MLLDHSQVGVGGTEPSSSVKVGGGCGQWRGWGGSTCYPTSQGCQCLLRNLTRAVVPATTQSLWIWTLDFTVGGRSGKPSGKMVAGSWEGIASYSGMLAG